MIPIWKDRIAIYTGLFGMLLMAIYLLLYFEMDGVVDFGVCKFLNQTIIGKGIALLIIKVGTPLFFVAAVPFFYDTPAYQALFIIFPLALQGLIYLGIGRFISYIYRKR